MENEEKPDVNSRKNDLIRTYRDLIIWQKPMNFVTEIYRKTRGFPRNEQFGLILLSILNTSIRRRTTAFLKQAGK